MTVNISDDFKIFAEKIMKSQYDDVRRWASQNNNLLLKQLAKEVLDIVEKGMNSEDTQKMAGDIEKIRQG